MRIEQNINILMQVFTKHKITRLSLTFFFKSYIIKLLKQLETKQHHVYKLIQSTENQLQRVALLFSSKNMRYSGMGRDASRNKVFFFKLNSQ